MIGQWILLVIICICGGMAVAGGVFAFLSVLQLIPRMAFRLRLASRAYDMESSIFLGGMAGTILSVFRLPLPVGSVGLCFFGFFSGIFVGCIAMALAETLKVLPILIARVKFQKGLPYVVASMALGKALGSFYQLYFR